MSDKTCNHEFWGYPHEIIAGKHDGWVCIVRYCLDCGLRQMAHIAPAHWTKAKGDYARDEHYA